jgi:1-acyl-sn-glycerol-3-phosphate acyltransferase
MLEPSEFPEPNASHTLALVRVILLVGWTCIMFLPVLTFWALRCDRWRGSLVRRMLAGVCRIIGLRVIASGSIAPERPLLLVANHAGYLDVFALGGLAPVSFTPKREVRRWPIIGFFCVLADCVFVERTRTAMEEARANMRKRLSKDQILCIFPEGTTSDNSGVIPFKSGFFSLAEAGEGEEALPVQPATLAYTEIDGMKMRDAWRPRVAWVGDDTFFDHFWRVLKLRSITARVEFHPALRLGAEDTRKTLSQRAQQQIGASLAQIHAEAA